MPDRGRDGVGPYRTWNKGELAALYRPQDAERVATPAELARLVSLGLLESLGDEYVLTDKGRRWRLIP